MYSVYAFGKSRQLQSDFRSQTPVDGWRLAVDGRRSTVDGRHGDTVGDRHSGFWILESRRAVRVGAEAMGGRVDRGSRVGFGGAQCSVTSQAFKSR